MVARSEPEASEGKRGYLLFSASTLQIDCPLEEVDAAKMQEVRRSIVGFCLIEQAAEIVGELDEPKYSAIEDRIIAEFSDSDAYISQFDENERAYFVAEEIARIKVAERIPFASAMDMYRRATKPTGRCRILFPRKMFDDAGAWSYREFAMLCGVWGAIGDDAAKIVSMDRIAAIAAGYSSIREIPKSMLSKVLSESKRRTTLKNLEARGLFVRCPGNERHNYYSRKLTLPQLQAYAAKDQAEKALKRAKSTGRLQEVKRMKEQFIKEATARDYVDQIVAAGSQHINGKSSASSRLYHS